MTMGVCYGGEITLDEEKMSLVAIDVETTGLSARSGGRIIEVGAVVVENGTLGEEFNSLVNPGVKIPGSATRIHGITNTMLRHQPPPNSVFRQLQKFMGRSTLIAHNAAFDMAFLRAEFTRMDWEFDYRQICTLRMSRQLLPGLANYKLATVHKYLYGSKSCGSRRHRALADAQMAGRIWLRLFERGQDNSGSMIS